MWKPIPWLAYTLSLGLLASQVTANAALGSYGAHLERSEWRVSEYSPLQCTLTHDIPRYGEVRFLSEASREMNMRMVLDMRRQPDTYDQAQIYSTAPDWRPGIAPRHLGELALYKQYDSDINKQMSWVLLTELEKGMVPTITYQDWHNANDRVQVKVSAINFPERYEDFLECVSNLLPFGFDDIAFTVLNYQPQEAELTNASKRKLMRVGEYLRHDQDIELVLVVGYSDAYGTRDENQALSEARAEMVKSFLIEQGLSDQQISVRGYGEMRHAAANDTELERAQNRRAVVQISRPFNQELLGSR